MRKPPVAGADVERGEAGALRELQLPLEEEDLVDRVEEVAAERSVAGIRVRPAAEGPVFAERLEKRPGVPLLDLAHEDEVLERGDPRQLAVVPGDHRLAAEVAQVEEGLDLVPRPSGRGEHRQVQPGVAVPKLEQARQQCSKCNSTLPNRKPPSIAMGRC